MAFLFTQLFTKSFVRFSLLRTTITLILLLILLPVISFSTTIKAESQQASSIIPILTYLLLPSVDSGEQVIPPYDRDEWGYWITVDGINTRGRVLIRDGLIDGNTGDRYWICPYTGLRFDNATDIDIDHVVSLYDVHYSGGYKWSYEKRLEFYNDMENLLATWDSENRRKGSLTPIDWHPPLVSYRAKYAQIYRDIKLKWGLTITPEQELAIQDLLEQ